MFFLWQTDSCLFTAGAQVVHDGDQSGDDEDDVVVIHRADAEGQIIVELIRREIAELIKNSC